MGNRLSSLPLPSFVGGTVDCGPEPVLLPETGRETAAADEEDDEVDAFVYVQEGRDFYGSSSNTIVSGISGREDPLKLDEARGYGTPVAYASTFFLKGLESGSYLYSPDGDLAGQNPTVEASSLITFHSQGAEQINFRGDKNLINVEEGHIVTVYANIESGKYLCPGPQSTRRMYWKSNVHLMAKQPPHYEWRVRRHASGRNPADAAAAQPSQNLRSPSYFRRTLKLLPSFGLRRPSLDESTLTNMAAQPSSASPILPRRHSQGDLRSLRRSRTSPERGSPGGAPGLSSSDCSAASQGLRVAVPPPPPASEPLGAGDSPGRQPAAAEANSRSASRPQTASSEPCASREEESQMVLSAEVKERTLRFGDVITLESKSRPGCFLVAKPGHAQLQLSSIEEGLFVIAPPQLKHLVRLSGNAHAPERLTRLDAPKKVSKEDAAWLRLLQRLPHDLVYRILQFKGKWVRASRLVSKDWCRAAEQHVFSIRVNGEYAGVNTLEERRNLLRFVQRCRHLTSLTLRNLDDLLDEEVATQIMDCVYLRRLALGGCRRLGDAAFTHLDALARITHLNVAATQVTDEFLEIVSRSCKRLENLNLYGCKQVSLRGIERVLRLPSLVSINIRGTSLDKATADSLQRAHLPKQVLVGAAASDGVYG